MIIMYSHAVHAWKKTRVMWAFKLRHTIGSPLALAPLPPAKHSTGQASQRRVSRVRGLTGVKSLRMLYSILISSGVFPLRVVATFAQVRSSSGLMSR